MGSQRIGTFYGVGIGPGDPELMTVKAMKVLKGCEILAVPQTASGETAALDIVRQAVSLEGKQILPLYFTMSRDRTAQRAAHEEAAGQLRPYLAAGRDIVMPVLGDVSLFSTYCYLMERLKEEGVPCAMIPGVPSFCAVAARLGRSLTEMDQPLHIVSGGSAQLSQMLELPGGKVLMKSGKALPEVYEQLERRGLLEKSAMVHNCGMPGEEVFDSLEDKPPIRGYFTTIIVPE